MCFFRLAWPVRYTLLALVGILQAFSTAWPLANGRGQAIGSLQILALALGLVLIAGPEKGYAYINCNGVLTTPSRFWQGFRRGWFFAIAWMAATFWWLYISMHFYGGLPAWLSAVAVFLLAVIVALYYALVCGVWALARSSLGALSQVLLFAALWLMAELCRGVFFTGFPWGAIGYAHIDSLLAGYAPWVGVYGISAIAAILSALLWQSIQMVFEGKEPREKRQFFFLTAAILAVCLLFFGWGLKNVSFNRIQPSLNGGLNVALLQGNIAQEEKFQPNGGMQTALQWYGQQMRTIEVDLQVLPETALPLLPQQLPPQYWSGLEQRFSTGNQAVLIGMPAGNMQTGYVNAVIGMVPGGAQIAGNTTQQSNFSLPPSQQALYRYAKHHLVPFGEFIPFGFQWFVNMMNIPLGSFQRGVLDQPRLVFKGERLQPNICYEDLFGEELAASFREPETAPTILVNVSNIAWFGDTVAIDQHRQISRMRAIELARPMLRATNTGSTAVIEASGRVQQELPRYTRGVLYVKVVGNHAKPTFFAWWAARWGLWPLWIIGLISIGALLRLRHRREQDSCIA